MTAEQKIKRDILMAAIKENEDLVFDGEITEENVDEAYEKVLIENDAHWDYESEFRSSGEGTGIKCDYDRNYESKSVARKLEDGSWVGWTYWYGGGKYGNPGEIDWMDEAYELEVDEKEVMQVVRTFKKKD